MSVDLRAQLERTLGDAYRLERELGGGGMSRVFVAEELRLQRKVVVKVLSPDLAQGLSVERFEREIRTVAALQQANIVPVLTAGDTEGLPFYTMPYVPGESLRAVLGRGPLAIAEVIGVLKDVSKALAYAHQGGVVHRDIKPDNVLLSGGTAVVTDFGIAKAISAARTGSGAATLTQIGTSIGTPAYMAPEQAAGDANVDHRADIYSLGAMAYELLTGQAVFADRTPQRMLAAHMSEAPKPVADLRPDTPAALADLVMKCLAKDAAQRPQNAGELLRSLETTSGGGMAAMPAVLLGGPAMFGKALALYAAAFIVVAIVARAAIVGIGLPDWVFPGSLIVMALGLPVILWTAYVQRVTRRALIQTPSYTPGGTPSVVQGTIATMALKAAPHVSWYRTARGGVYAVGTFIGIVGVFMAMRAFGVGPAASLLSSGALSKDDQILLADFGSPAADTSLGGVITDALRSELAQSRTLNLVPVARVRETLQRMQRPSMMRIGLEEAREIANREGVKAIIDGEVLAIGSSRVLTARLVASQSGDVLSTFSETAKSDDAIVDAIDRLARALRSKVGESLRSVHATPSIARVTTPSFAALKKFVQGDRAVGDGEFDRGHALLEEAIALDSGFAMARRRLAMSLNNFGTQTARVHTLLQEAYDHRARLSDEERLLTEAAYYSAGPRQDDAKTIAAYEAALELAPDNFIALNNLAVAYRRVGNFAKAGPLHERGTAVDSTRNTTWLGMVNVLARTGRLGEAEKMAIESEARFPRGSAQFANSRAQIIWAAGNRDSAVRLADRLPALAGRNAAAAAGAAATRANMAQAMGRLRHAERLRAVQDSAQAAGDAEGAQLGIRLNGAFATVWYRDDRAAAGRQIDAALAATPLASIDPVNRPHVALVRALAAAGRVDAAKAALADFERSRRGLELLADARQRAQMNADIAMSERRYSAAAEGYRAAEDRAVPWARLPDLARAYDLAGNADSAIAVYRRYVDVSEFGRLGSEAFALGPALERVAQLEEAKGDATSAAQHYRAFVELWKSADPELQPRVAEARRRIASLAPIERPKR